MEVPAFKAMFGSANDEFVLKGADLVLGEFPYVLCGEYKLIMFPKYILQVAVDHSSEYSFSDLDNVSFDTLVRMFLFPRDLYDEEVRNYLVQFVFSWTFIMLVHTEFLKGMLPISFFTDRGYDFSIVPKQYVQSKFTAELRCSDLVMVNDDVNRNGIDDLPELRSDTVDDCVEVKDISDYQSSFSVKVAESKVISKVNKGDLAWYECTGDPKKFVERLSTFKFNRGFSQLVRDLSGDRFCRQRKRMVTYGERRVPNGYLIFLKDNMYLMRGMLNRRKIQILSARWNNMGDKQKEMYLALSRYLFLKRRNAPIVVGAFDTGYCWLVLFDEKTHSVLRELYPAHIDIVDLLELKGKYKLLNKQKRGIYLSLNGRSLHVERSVSFSGIYIADGNAQRIFELFKDIANYKLNGLLLSDVCDDV